MALIFHNHMDPLDHQFYALRAVDEIRQRISLAQRDLAAYALVALAEGCTIKTVADASGLPLERVRELAQPIATTKR